MNHKIDDLERGRIRVPSMEGRRFLKEMFKDLEEEYETTLRLTDKDPDKMYVLKIKYNNSTSMYTAEVSKFNDLKSHDFLIIENHMIESIILTIKTKGYLQGTVIYRKHFV